MGRPRSPCRSIHFSSESANRAHGLAFSPSGRPFRDRLGQRRDPASWRSRCPTQGGRLQLETMYSTVDDRVATLVLNRPHVLNCANEQWARDLNTLVDDLASNDHLRVVVVRGAGRAFCSGIDLTALSHGEIEMTFFRHWEG